jgi:putative membrane protein
MVFTLILALAFALVAVIFALQNTEMVTVSFFSLSYEGSLALVILVAVALGILIGVLVMIPGKIKNKISSTRNRRKIGSLEASLDEHKSKLAELEKPAPPEPEADELKSPDSD